VTRPDGSAAVDEALEALRYHWGDAYDIGVGAGRWEARRVDGLGSVFAALSADGLEEKIRADYGAMPVPRDDAPAAAEGMP
jgi:hypothetical protein